MCVFFFFKAQESRLIGILFINKKKEKRLIGIIEFILFFLELHRYQDNFTFLYFIFSVHKKKNTLYFLRKCSLVCGDWRKHEEMWYYKEYENRLGLNYGPWKLMNEMKDNCHFLVLFSDYYVEPCIDKKLLKTFTINVKML